MKTETVRATLAIIVIGGVMLVAGLVFILPALGGMQNVSQFKEAGKEWFGIFSGIVGVIIGYYFGKKD